MYRSLALFVIVALFVCGDTKKDCLFSDECLKRPSQNFLEKLKPGIPVVTGPLTCLYSGECLKRAAQNLLEKMKPGIPGLTEPLDPFHEDRIECETPDVKYVATNVTLIGMKNCQIELLSVVPEDLTYVYIIQCPHFILNGEYTATGTLDSRRIDHEGSFRKVIDDYRVTFKGQDTTSGDRDDIMFRMFIKEYYIDKQTTEKITFEIKSVRDEDQEKADLLRTHLMEIWSGADAAKYNTIMSKFWSKYMEELNVYLKSITFKTFVEYSTVQRQ